MSANLRTQIISYPNQIQEPCRFMTHRNYRPLNHQTNKTYYYHVHPEGISSFQSGHHQGSIIALTNEYGEVAESIIYDGDFGEEFIHLRQETTFNPYGYTGREYDMDDLYYYRARYYDPTTQRFLSMDPIEFEAGDVNFYRYVGNDCVNFVDPTGLDTEVLIGGPYGDHAYGHAALRVFGNGYDKIYDFGRYGKTFGLLGSEGEGILRVWSNSKQYIIGENATGRTTTGYIYKTSESEDKSIIAYYDSLLDKCRKDPRRDMKSCHLPDNYTALNNNCTTKTIDGVNASNPALASKFKNIAESKGRGLGFFEKKAAGDSIGSSIFMPADLEANIKNEGSYYQTNTYKK